MCNGQLLADGIADVLPQRRHVLRQLHSNGGDKRSQRLELAAAAYEEEAGAKTPLVGAAAGNRVRDTRLFRARHAVKPVDTRAIVIAAVAVASGLPGRPCHNVVQHMRARVGQAQRIPAAAVVVEGRLLLVWKLVEQLRAIGRGQS